MIAIISDIHGNFEALKAVMSEIDELKPERIISLGDVAGYYPQINECVDLLRQYEVENIMGNHDYYLVSGTGCPRSTTANTFLQLQAARASSETVKWLSKSRTCLVDDEVSMVHGGWSNPLDEYLYEIDSRYFSGFPQRFFFSGHTHVQALFELDHGQVYCNPGAVGQPRDGIPTAGYALFDGESIQLCRVEYDVDAVVEVLKQADFGEYYYESLYNGTRIGGKIDTIKLVGSEE